MASDVASRRDPPKSACDTEDSGGEVETHGGSEQHGKIANLDEQEPADQNGQYGNEKRNQWHDDKWHRGTSGLIARLPSCKDADLAMV